ncbi:hypothetical protein GCM10017667_78390 [Streptomyces filamentosus]|uniref:Uncharacterized protein n=1 Tax=Streptomyces filamentosus TaxID=67294 RepID=A0A919C071_STRFL|nr:hypothetical protein GCM10017667_78390 [Streptomyces filamentosus]
MPLPVVVVAFDPSCQQTLSSAAIGSHWIRVAVGPGKPGFIGRSPSLSSFVRLTTGRRGSVDGARLHIPSGTPPSARTKALTELPWPAPSRVHGKGAGVGARTLAGAGNMTRAHLPSRG